MSHEFFGEEDFSYPSELKFSLRALTSVARLKELRQKRRDYMNLNYPALRPLYDRGGPVSVYQGPSGPIATIHKAMRGDPEAIKAIENGALNDPNTP